MKSLEGLRCRGWGGGGVVCKGDCPLTMVLKALRADLYPLTGAHFLRSSVSVKPSAVQCPENIARSQEDKSHSWVDTWTAVRSLERVHVLEVQT